MAKDIRMICDSRDLADRGKGVRFSIEHAGVTTPAFGIRYRGKAYAYLNHCAHMGVELDWNGGEFFDDSGLYLICSTHGAIYLPETGQCAAGPCKGGKLERLAAEEKDGKVYVIIQKG